MINRDPGSVARVGRQGHGCGPQDGLFCRMRFEAADLVAEQREGSPGREDNFKKAGGDGGLQVVVMDLLWHALDNAGNFAELVAANPYTASYEIEQFHAFPPISVRI